MLSDYRLDQAVAFVVFPAGDRMSQKARALCDDIERSLADSE